MVDEAMSMRSASRVLVAGLASAVVAAALAAIAPRHIDAQGRSRASATSCLPDSRTAASPLTPILDLKEADDLYAAALALDPGPPAPPVTRAMTDALLAFQRAVLSAGRTYRNLVSSRPAFASDAWTRRADLLDLLATRALETSMALSGTAAPDPSTNTTAACQTYCEAAEAYGHALEADPTNRRAAAQLTAYGPAYRGVTLASCTRGPRGDTR